MVSRPVNEEGVAMSDERRPPDEPEGPEEEPKPAAEPEPVETASSGGARAVEDYEQKSWLARLKRAFRPKV
jgi:hypothetical protein